MDPSMLQPFHGYQSSLIPFSAGHYLYLCSWDSTPNGLSSYANIWVTTPEDKRILLADPAASSDVACIYHEFHEIHAASISLDWASENHLRVQCSSDPAGLELRFELRLRETFWSRLLPAIASSPPTRFTVSKMAVGLSSFLVNALVAKGGITLLGATETGQPFYVGTTERLMLIEDGSATMNGEDLGSASGPTWPVEFGDFVPCGQPVLRRGALYLLYEEEKLAGA